MDPKTIRYKNFWLPLLAKEDESEASEVPLVVPLDCEWIWHCHRLNPVCYFLTNAWLFIGISYTPIGFIIQIYDLFPSSCSTAFFFLREGAIQEGL